MKMKRKDNRLTEVIATLKSDNSTMRSIQFIPLETKEMLIRNSRNDEICIPGNSINEFPLQAWASNPPRYKMKTDMGQKIELKISLRETPWKCTNFYRFVHSKGSYAFGGQNMHNKWSFLAQKPVVLSTIFIFRSKNDSAKGVRAPQHIDIAVMSEANSKTAIKNIMYFIDTTQVTRKTCVYPTGVYLGITPDRLDKCSKYVKMVI